MTLLKVNIDALIDYQAPLVNSDRDSHMVSIDVTKITGATATAIPNDTNIFYDSEVLAIICRSKSKSSGLVATTIWGWQGKRSHMSDKEEQKFQDLAKRYGTAVVSILPIHIQRILMFDKDDGTAMFRACAASAYPWRTAGDSSGESMTAGLFLD